VPADGQLVHGLVSTIIPVYNRPLMLRDAVASVLAQTYRPIEILVVDDGSTDETPAVVADLARAHPEVRPLRQKNAGPGVARETGRRVARGEFLQHLDSDDLLLPRKCEVLVDALRRQPECGAAYGKTRTMGGAEDARPRKRTGEALDRMFPAFLYERWWDTSTPLFRRRVTDAAGPWTLLWNQEDWEYDCRVAALGTRLAYRPEWVSEHREHSGQRLHDRGSLRTRLEHCASAHILMFGHAIAGDIVPGSDPMCHFSRELFLLCRQCGAEGLTQQARELHRLARLAAGRLGRRGDLALYRALASVLGWRRMGSWSSVVDAIRHGGLRQAPI